MVFAAVVQRYRAPNDVVVDVAGVEMGRHHGLVPPGQQLIGQFHADLMRQFRRDFARGKALHKVVTLHAAGFVPAVGVGFHVGKRRFAQAAEPRFKADGLGLVAVEGVVHRFFQRTRLCGFGFISHIVHRPVQAAHGDERGVSHATSPVFFDDAVDLRGQRRHFVHAFLPGHAGAVGPVGQLVGVVAETRHLAQQVGMVSTGARMKFAAHDQSCEYTPRGTGRSSSIAG